VKTLKYEPETSLWWDGYGIMVWVLTFVLLGRFCQRRQGFSEQPSGAMIDRNDEASVYQERII